jgi:putative signal transducing protein
MAHETLVVVRTFPNRIEADLAKSALDAADLESMVRADDAGGLRPGMWSGNPVELLVRREDVRRAHEILEGSA